VHISNEDVLSQFDTSLIQALFGRRSTEGDVGRIVESTNVHCKLRVLIKKRINMRGEVARLEGFGK